MLVLHQDLVKAGQLVALGVGVVLKSMVAEDVINAIVRLLKIKDFLWFAVAAAAHLFDTFSLPLVGGGSGLDRRRTGGFSMRHKVLIIEEK